MSKKQIESTLFEEVWFMDLDLEYKMLMLYFFITCDHAGLGNLNFKMINMILGHDYDKENVFIFLGDQMEEYKHSFLIEAPEEVTENLINFFSNE